MDKANGDNNNSIISENECYAELAKDWGSPIVTLEKMDVFTGYAISPRYMANLYSQGLGPEGSFKIGRKRVWPVKSVISWLKARKFPSFNNQKLISPQ